MSTSFTRPSRSVKDHHDEFAFHFIMEADNGHLEEELWTMAERQKEQLKAPIAEILRANFGSSFEFRGIETTRGSVQFWIILGGAYELISHYDDFVNSVQRAMSQLQRLLKSVFGAVRGLSIMGTITAVPFPGPAEEQTGRLGQLFSRDLVTTLLVSYLIVSHAALLIVILRLLVKLTFKP